MDTFRGDVDGSPALKPSPGQAVRKLRSIEDHLCNDGGGVASDEVVPPEAVGTDRFRTHDVTTKGRHLRRRPGNKEGENLKEHAEAFLRAFGIGFPIKQHLGGNEPESDTDQVVKHRSGNRGMEGGYEFVATLIEETQAL